MNASAEAERSSFRGKSYRIRQRGRCANAKALVFSVDEKSQIQALDRTQMGLPLKKGRCGTMAHDYKRHGTTSLFAAFNMLDGKAIGHPLENAYIIQQLDPAKKNCHALASVASLVPAGSAGGGGMAITDGSQPGASATHSCRHRIRGVISALLLLALVGRQAVLFWLQWSG